MSALDLITAPADSQTLLAIAGIKTKRPQVRLTREEYLSRCSARWARYPLRDATNNWTQFEQLRPVLEQALQDFRRDPFLTDKEGVVQNPDTTLTGMLWLLAAKLAPEKGALGPLLGFEETWQSVFLKRGLKVYCELLLREIEATE